MTDHWIDQDKFTNPKELDCGDMTLGEEFDIANIKRDKENA